MVSFFSKKVKEKVDLIRELSLKASAKDNGKHNMPKSPKNNVSVTESQLDDKKVSKPPTNFLFLSSRGILFGAIHGGDGAKSRPGQLFLAHRFWQQDVAEAASFHALAEADVGGFG